jgi:hypothetical protein
MENFNRIEYSTQLYSVTEIMEYIDNENIQLKGNIGGRLWNLKKKQRYIESFLLDLPMYPIIIDGALKNPKTGRYRYWIVVDGFNRLCALSEFYKGGFALKNGFYNDLSSYHQTLIDAKKIYCYILIPETKLTIRYDFFERMNPLANRQIIRNILNQGIANDLVQELSKEFEKVFKIDKRNDRINIPELVLTYIAKICFNKNEDVILSVFLDIAMSAIKRLNGEEIAKIRTNFLNKLKIIQQKQIYFEHSQGRRYFVKTKFLTYLCQDFAPFSYKLIDYSDKL